ncbi:MAG: diacylglycerol kinase family lipid kinase [Myxococcales bacterium]
MSQTVVIVNPHSRSGEIGRRLPELERLLQRHVPDHRVVLTEREGDGRRLAQVALAAGASRVAVAGGDGTTSEVVSGLFAAHERPAVELAILPCGSGGDFGRLLGLGRDLEVAVARLASGKRRQVDVGRVSYRGADDRPEVRWFLNIASFGMSADAAHWLAEQGRRGKRGPLSYIESGLRGVFSYDPKPVRVKVDGELVHTGKLFLGAAANGQYFGAGMQIAPHARPDDGVFDVVLAGQLGKAQALWLFPKLQNGRHLGDCHIKVSRGKLVELESDDEIWLEADGEPLGRLPARLELLPLALTLGGLP